MNNYTVLRFFCWHAFDEVQQDTGLYSKLVVFRPLVENTSRVVKVARLL